MSEEKKEQQKQERTDFLMEKMVLAAKEKKAGRLNEVLFDTLNYFIRRALRRLLGVDDLKLNEMLTERMNQKK